MLCFFLFGQSTNIEKKRTNTASIVLLSANQIADIFFVLAIFFRASDNKCYGTVFDLSFFFF